MYLAFISFKQFLFLNDAPCKVQNTVLVLIWKIKLPWKKSYFDLYKWKWSVFFIFTFLVTYIASPFPPPRATLTAQTTYSTCLTLRSGWVYSTGRQSALWGEKGRSSPVIHVPVRAFWPLSRRFEAGGSQMLIVPASLHLAEFTSPWMILQIFDQQGSVY